MNIALILKNAIKTIIPDMFMTYRLPRRFSNSILLTFDDGPDTEITIQVLKLLKQYNARALFFVVGKKVVRYPHVLKLIYEEGHIIGLHTYNHPNRVISSILEYHREIDKCHTVVKKVIGISPKLVRPPLGLSFATLMVPSLLHKRTVLWSRESGEWGINKHESSDTIIRILKNELIRRDIVLMHDDNPKVVTVLDQILPFLLMKGIDLASGIEYLS